MSAAHTRALLDVRACRSTEELADLAQEALEAIYEVSSDAHDLGHYIEELKQDAQDAQTDRDEADARVAEAESKLEEYLQANADAATFDELKADNVRLLAEVAALQAQVTAQSALAENLRNGVADVLTMSRKLVSTCEAAGITPAPVRAVKGGRRKAVAR